jgi:membrane protease YdiL (CAAX protease family)
MEPGGRTGMVLFITRHPYRSAIFFLILFFLFNIAGGLIGIPLLDQPELLITVASLIVAVGGVLVIRYLGWWKKAGYASAGPLSAIPLYILPAGIAFLPLFEGIPATKSQTVLLFAVLSISVALAEETFFRGLILQALVPAGMLRAVLLSSLLFGLPHLLNTIGGIWDPSFTIVDTFAAFGVGITFSALVIRTGTIWPPISLHALINFIALVSLGSIAVPPQTPVQLASTAIAGVVMVVYGLLLLRGIPQEKYKDVSF